MGKVWKFENDVDTDQIIPSQYLLLPAIEEMKQYTFEPLNENFAKSVKTGDIIVGGTNFGCGSSREQAPLVLQALGVNAVIASSFARIFFRNSINIGLPVIICPEAGAALAAGDEAEVDFQKGIIRSAKGEFKFPSLPPHIMEIFNKKGLINYINEKYASAK